MGLKPFDALVQAHPSTAVQGIRLEDCYRLAQACTLPEQVPGEIRERWILAQHLLVYSYFEYPFVPIADLVCAQVVEAAIRHECKELLAQENETRPAKRSFEPGLEKLLKLFRTRLLEQLEPVEADHLLERLAAFRRLRNSFAHEKGVTLYSPGTSLMVRTSEWLGAYYTGTLKRCVARWMEESRQENQRIADLIKQIKAGQNNGH